jgi:hypothetical protein
MERRKNRKFGDEFINLLRMLKIETIFNIRDSEIEQILNNENDWTESK